MTLTGLMTIDGKDAYTEYGAFLAEMAEDDAVNYAQLTLVPKAKEITQVSFYERNGVELPDTVTVRYEACDRTLQFCIYADTLSACRSKYDAFLKAVTGAKTTINVTGFRSYQLVFKSASQPSWYQDSKACAVVFQLTFLEPKPTV